MCLSVCVCVCVCVALKTVVRSGLQDSSSTQPCGLTDQSIQCVGVHVLRGPLVIIIHLSAAVQISLLPIMSVCSSSKVDVNFLCNCQHRK